MFLLQLDFFQWYFGEGCELLLIRVNCFLAKGQICLLGCNKDFSTGLRFCVKIKKRSLNTSLGGP